MIPLIVLVLASIEVYLGFKFNRFTDMSIRVLGQALSFNGIHVIFTPLYFLFVPEFQNFFKEKNIETKRWVIYKWIASIIFFGCLTSAAFLLFKTNRITMSQLIFLLNLYFGFYVFYLSIHGAGQNLGVSMMTYANASQRFGIVLPKRLIKTERMLWPHASLITLLNIIASFGVIGAYSNDLIILSTLTMLCHVSYLLFMLYKVGGNFIKYRALFYLRYFLYPLSFLSFFCSIGLAMSHGAENLLISEKVFNSDRILKGKKTKWVAAIFTLIYVFSFLQVINYGLSSAKLNGLPSTEALYILSFVVVNTVALFHIFIEGEIFKFKDSLVARNQGSLFFEQF